MKIIPASVEILDELDGDAILKKIELCGRVCYKSEERITEDSARKFVSDVIKRGHESVLEHVSFSVRFICDRGCCYDDQTKVLTDDGWKFFYDLRSDDVFYTLDENNNVCKTEANRLIKQRYEGLLQHWKSTQIDAMVTPNHNMWLFDYDKRAANQRRWKFIRSEDATNGRYKFNKSANPIGKLPINTSYVVPEVTIPRGFYSKVFPELFMDSILFFELVGWWVTDGSISFGTNGSGSRLAITQVKQFGRDRILYLLNSLGLDYYLDRNDIRINCPQLLSWLNANFLRNGDVRKTYYCSVPRWFFTDLGYNELDAFLQGVIGGNGSQHTGGPGFQIYTASYQFAEDLVELCLLLGKCANIRDIKGATRTFPAGHTTNCMDTFVVSVVSTTEHLFDSKCANKEDVYYDGYVYCVELPVHHRLYVMRNGKPFWCGNSHEIVRHRLASYSQESTRYCNYSKDGFGNEITVIKPCFMEIETASYEYWRTSCIVSAHAYFKMVEEGCSPQEARSVLPNSLKTELIMTANLREWRHFFKLRTAASAHPQMREVACKLLEMVKIGIPVIWDDIPG